MACVVPDMLEVEDPQTTELVTDDVSACKVAVDKTKIVEVAHGAEEIQPMNEGDGVSVLATHAMGGNNGPVLRR